jgi:hypothetical protein
MKVPTAPILPQVAQMVPPIELYNDLSTDAGASLLYFQQLSEPSFVRSPFLVCSYHCSRALDADIGARLDQGALELGQTAQGAKPKPRARWR